VLVIEKYEENVSSSLALHRGRVSVAPFGQCYAISDGTPIDNFQMLKPLCEARLCAYPDLEVPTAAALQLALLLETVHACLNFFGIPNSPFLTRSEVHKVGVTHFFSIEKARLELGYNPLISSTEGSERIAKYYR
jgi:nucleoside-diphosphate-sugar epimerase